MTLLLDTHALVWLDAGSNRLSDNAIRAIDNALAQHQLCVSAISFWEIGMLIEKQHLSLPMPLTTWRTELIQKGLQEVAVNGSIAMLAAELSEFHGDPMDRLIVATALANNMTLCSADNKILDWAPRQGLAMLNPAN
jgi:PIN domain nuclease of toxin-antitoxin system